MIQAETLRREMRRFTGNPSWYRSPLNKDMMYTDGVRFFAGAAEAYWFLDIVATELMPLQEDNPFLVITLEVAQQQGTVVVDDGDGNEVYRRSIGYTDCPEGAWKFYLTDNAMLLPSEY